VPNESETSLLTDLPVENPSQIDTAARALFERGVGAVILTLGKQGALVLDGSTEVINLSPHAVEVVDTTAAGDAFIAGLSVGLGKGMGLVESAKLANAAGALAVTKMGAQPAMPTLDEITDFMG
ncbi:MAG: PfkB family carbohydrate kinase, partial [Chloroflexota bacterium]